mgnify:CR=1 FL=1
MTWRGQWHAGYHPQEYLTLTQTNWMLLMRMVQLWFLSTFLCLYYINHDFQNFDENDKKGIPLVLKHLIDREEETFVKPLVDEIIPINVGAEKDPRLVQIGSM